MILETVTTVGQLVERRKECTQQFGHHGNQVDDINLEQKLEHGMSLSKGHRHEHRYEDGRHQMGDVAQKGVVEEDVIPRGACATSDTLYDRDEKMTAQGIGKEYNKRNGDHHDGPINPVVFIDIDVEQAQKALDGFVHFCLYD